jgi:hypothetical protein
MGDEFSRLTKEVATIIKEQPIDSIEEQAELDRLQSIYECNVTPIIQ